MKILCPTDFSDHSGVALKESIFIANKTKSKIILLSVFSVPTSSASFISMEDVIQKNTEEDLNKIKENIASQLLEGVEIETTTIKGSPSKIICDYARNHKVDLIVMGTQGSTNLQNILVGSVTKAVFKSSSIPVLAIPVNSEKKEINKNFLIALDNEPLESKETIAIIPELLEIYKAKLDVFHVSKKEDLLPIDPIIEEYLPGIIENIVIKEGKKTVEIIKSYVVDQNVSLLIMIRRKKSMWEKLFVKGYTEEELYRTRIPLLMLPEINEV